MNTIDVSPEKVAQGWLVIEQEFGLVDQPEETGKPVEGEHIAGDQESTGESSENTVYTMTPEERAEKEHDMTQVLVQGMTFAFAFLRVNHVPDNVKEDFAKSWAVVIVKRFPDNPVGKFYEEYADLIAAGGSTLVLIGAIRESKVIDRQQANGALKNGMKEAKAEAMQNG